MSATAIAPNLTSPTEVIYKPEVKLRSSDIEDRIRTDVLYTGAYQDLDQAIEDSASAISDPTLKIKKEIFESLSCYAQTLSIEGPFKPLLLSHLEGKLLDYAETQKKETIDILKLDVFKHDRALSEIMDNMDYKTQSVVKRCCFNLEETLIENKHSGTTFFLSGITLAITSGLAYVYLDNHSVKTSSIVGIVSGLGMMLLPLASALCKTSEKTESIACCRSCKAKKAHKK